MWTRRLIRRPSPKRPACVLIALGLMFGAVAQRPEPFPLKVTSVSLDGAEVQDISPGVTVPSKTRNVRIEFASSTSGGAAFRVRYRLKGFDTEWQDPPAQMRAVIHFLDAQDLEVGASVSYVSGTSSGWRGSIESSDFQPREMEAVAPSRCARAYVEFVSGGSEGTLGLHAFRNFDADVVESDGRKQHFDFPTNPGIDLENPLGTPAGWMRQGSNPGMAMVRAVSNPAPDYALVLNDDDGRSYCGWRMTPAKAIAVQPGQGLQVRWEECFNIGAAGPATATYRYLRPGSYRFQMLMAAASGQPLGRVNEISLIVRPPLWQEPWPWMLSAAAVTGLVAFAVRHATQRRMQQRLAEVERQHALEGERTRIAQDIHDDLGAGLAQIAMLSELAQADAPGEGARRAHLEEIYIRAQAAGRKLDEIVWAINPAHDSAEDLVGYLARFAQDYLRLARIRFRLDVPPSLQETSLSSGERHQIFLAAKEAIHNAARHSSAQEISLKVRVEQGCLCLTVTDNGCGFTDAKNTAHSRGSASMRARMGRIGGQFQRSTSPGRGTSVIFKLPVRQSTQ